MNEAILDVSELIKIIFSATLPGAAGGFISFIWAYLNGKYYNNRYKTKASLEIIGGMVVASFLVPGLFADVVFRRMVLIAFVVGVSWGVIIQAIRNNVTFYVEKKISNPSSNTTEEAS